MKVGIVGPQESKWLSIQKDKVKKVITTILSQYQFERNLVMVSGGCPLGGVDIWAEEVAKERGIDTDIIKPEVNQWNDEIFKDINYNNEEFIVGKLMGYKSRNIKIAETCDVLYCIVPYSRNEICWHHPLKGSNESQEGHPRNGGCWTMRYANKIGKETHLVIIE